MITEGAKGNLFVFGIALFVVNVLGMLALGLGLFVTIPMAMIAKAFIYRRLSSYINEAPASTITKVI